MQRGLLRGREVAWHRESRQWYWSDINLPVIRNPRPCPHCSEMPIPGGSDPVFAATPGAKACVHGVHVGYINWPDKPVGVS